MKMHLVLGFIVLFVCIKAYPANVPASLSIKGSALNESDSPIVMKKRGMLSKYIPP